jgi:hypothetical protein
LLLLGEKQEDGKYKHTVDLPKTTFELRANSVQQEPELQKLWDDNQVLKRVSERNTGCAPDSVRCANGSKSSTVGCTNLGKQSAPDCEQWMSGGAPDCPVHHPTEGMICLPGLPPTAPSCLRAIKGTPRRMEEDTKHSLIIPKHQDSILAHLIRCDSNLSSF